MQTANSCRYDLANPAGGGAPMILRPEDLKKMVSHLFFLYAAERHRVERTGEEPNEDFFYAGNNIYKQAIVAQIMAEDDEEEYEEEDWDDEDPDGGDEDE